MSIIKSRAAEQAVPGLPAWAPALALCLCAAAALPGCGGGSGGGGGAGAGSGGDTPPPATVWRSTPVRTLDLGGMTSPWVAATPGGDERIHIAYFEDDPHGPAPYRITRLTIDPAAAPRDQPGQAAAAETVVQVDNCSGLALAPAPDGGASVLYQGGVPRTCGAELQSDLMLSIDDGNGWREYTAAIGENPRNPYFFDGLAGAEVAVTSDGQGRVHAVYQFYHEGCDAMNFRYPDLRYVRFDPSDPTLPVEETVEGNNYDGDNVQNTVGDHVAIVMDGDSPVVFYEATLADGSHGLRTARRDGPTWTTRWVETGCEVGHISAARSAADGSLGVAYYVTRTTDHRDDLNCLRFAELTGGQWSVRTLDESSLCGEYCSLTFNTTGDAAVVYRAVETHTGYPLEDLMLARRTDGVWERETLAASGDLGHFNSAWFGTDGHLRVVTYSAAEQTIQLLEEVAEASP